MPTREELTELRDVLLKHALGKDARRKRCALNQVFERHIQEGERCRIIQVGDILTSCPSKAENPNEAVHHLMAEITQDLDAFYGDRPKAETPPHFESRTAKYRVSFKGDGNYALNFPPHRFKSSQPDWVSRFW